MKSAVGRGTWKQAQGGHLESWDEYVRRGAREAPGRRNAWRALWQEVERHAPLKAGERVLDIGCGLDTALEFAPAPVRGVTVDTLAAQLAHHGLAPAAAHTAGALEELPFRDAAFERVLLMNVLDHVRDARAGLVEVARVLAPGGVLVLSVDTYAGRRLLSKRLHKWWARTRGARTKHPLVFSEPAVRGMLRGCGLEPGKPQHVPGTKDRRRLFVARKR